MQEPKRTLNLFDAVMLVSGSMIGSGIFIVSADMVRVLGSPFWVLFCWILSGVITLVAALSYGELAGMMPQAGGQYIYLRRAFGRLTAFVYGWTVFMVIQTGVIAAVAVAFARYVGVLFPVFDESNAILSIGTFSFSTTQLLAVGLVFFLSWLNSRGINNGKLIQRVFTSAKILALLALIVIGLALAASSGNWSRNMSMPLEVPLAAEYGNSVFAIAAAVGVALIGSLFSSDAWNNVTFIAGEMKNPQRNIPLGLLFGVCLVTVLYILANVAYFMLLPAWGDPAGVNATERGIAYAQNDRVGSAAMEVVFGGISSSIMAILIIVSTFGCNNGLILSGARLFHAMSREGLFFRSASHINRFEVPSKALWWQGGWASVLCLSGTYGELLDYCTFASLVFYIITISGLIVLRRKEPATARPYRVPFYPALPVLYMLLAGGVCLSLLFMKPVNTLLGILIMAAGLPVFYFFSKSEHARKFTG
jgi:basic amino acid/polyamine antiporter, APA family